MQRLKNKKVLITGGTSGIGKAIAHTFAMQGANIVILGTHEGRANEVVNNLNTIKINDSQQFMFRIADVSNTQDIKHVINDILAQWSCVDIVVNAAGITRDKLFLKMSEDDWDIVLSTNLKSIYNVIHPLSRSMVKAKKGSIINISSVMGLMGNPGQVNYCASKHGMIGATRALAKEFGSRNITVNCIAPGFIETPMTDSLSDAVKEHILTQIPLKRLGSPNDIAEAALFLATASYITGEVLTIDGGMLA